MKLATDYKLCNRSMTECSDTDTAPNSDQEDMVVSESVEVSSNARSSETQVCGNKMAVKGESCSGVSFNSSACDDSIYDSGISLHHRSITHHCSPDPEQKLGNLQLAMEEARQPLHQVAECAEADDGDKTCQNSPQVLHVETNNGSNNIFRENMALVEGTTYISVNTHMYQEEKTPTKMNPNRTLLKQSSPTRMFAAEPESSCDLLLAHKRKSEMEKELISPGKRVRSMPEANATMILNMQSYNTSPSSSQYGHFPLSPQTATCRRRNSSKTKPPAQLESWLNMFLSWDSAEKTTALNELLSVCDSAHVRHLMAVIEPQFQRDFISLLPKELALHVLSFLSPQDLLVAAQTCQYWRILTEDCLLWRDKCKEIGASADGLPYIANPELRKGEALSDENIDWKSVFLHNYTIDKHWKNGQVKPTKILRGHDDHVITCLEFSGNRIVSGSDDNTLKVWDVDTGECLRTLTGHTGGVWSSQMSENIVISGSTDRTLRVWDTDSGECLHVLHGHTSTVRCMHLHGKTVVSGSRDSTLRMWDIMSGECKHVLMGHVAAVRCVQYDGFKVVSGAYDYTVRVWDPDKETCIHVLQGHTNRVYSLQFDGKHIVSGSLDTSIRVWDADSGTCLHTLIGHQSLTSGMEIQNGLLVSGNADSTVKVWDINTGACLQTLSGSNKHQGAVTCLQFTPKFVITSSDDGTVKLWSLQTGEFIRNLVSLESGGSGGVVWRIKADKTLLVCASGSRNGTEETKLIVLDFGLKESQEHVLRNSYFSRSLEH